MMDHRLADAGEIIAEHSRSFSWAAKCLPKSCRTDIEKLYAWCRACDDAVDGAASLAAARDELSMLRCDVARISLGRRPLHPASGWLADLMTRRKIVRQHADDLLEGMRMDVDGDPINNRADLDRYCYHVAGVVGLMMCGLMGTRQRMAHSHAVSLGIAMQLTNIARDVREDAERGRSYLPGINNATLASEEELTAAVNQLLAAAEVRYEHGLAGLRYLPQGCRPAIRMAAALYREIGREIRRRKYRVWQGRTVLPSWRIGWVAACSSLRSVADYLPLKYQRFQTNISTQSSQEHLVSDPRHTAYLGLSLTSFMAAALFMLVYVNPKDESYAWLPLLYAGLSVVIGVATNVLARARERTFRLATAPARSRA